LYFYEYNDYERTAAKKQSRLMARIDQQSSTHSPRGNAAIRRTQA
jgi:hypothetical protein